jgi:FtsP/CotA-like multicopper oxidase with cupredoxin domain
MSFRSTHPRVIRNVGFAILLALAACAPTAKTVVTAGPDTTQPSAAQTHQMGTSGTADASTMQQMEEAAVKAFPAKTQGVGGRVLRPRIVGGYNVFELTPKVVNWEVTPGQFVEAYGYNSEVPGPEIRVRQGDRIKVILHNALPEPTVIHFHGLTVPNAMDGVPFITQPPVQPGGSFTYTFTVRDGPGTYMYHSHENATVQVGKGLLGAFIVEPARRSWNIEQTIVLNDAQLGFTLNGKGFPATSPIVATLGQRALIRFINEGQMLHPMHLHGFHFTVVATDGHPVTPYVKDTIVVAPGERYDVLFTADNPGVWALHCHILPHVEGSQGMFGMVTAVIVR